jgi:GT2 family glycosyltransferase
MKNGHRAKLPLPSGLHGRVEAACWIQDEVLLIAAHLPAAVGPFEVGLAGRPRRRDFVPLDAQCLAYSRPEAGCRRWLILARLPGVRWPSGRLGQLAIRTRRGVTCLAPPRSSPAVSDLKTLVRNHLAGLPAESRADLIDFLVPALLPSASRPDGLERAHVLFDLREALRERFAYCGLWPQHAQGLHADALMAIDSKSFYVRGSAWNGNGEVSLFAVAPEGSRAGLATFRYARADGGAAWATTDAEPKRGFISYFQLRAPSHLPRGWILEMHGPDGAAAETAMPEPLLDRAAARSAILADLAVEPRSEELLETHVHPALTALQTQHMAAVEVESVAQYGTPPGSPEVTVVVPLYQRIDFVEQQVCQFSLDPQMAEADLVYVLDSPELQESLRETAGQLSRLHRVAFRVVALKGHSGYSAANNAGASLARGRLLLLLNSDVLPDRPGWLRPLADFYDATPHIGALGPKLLYEDDSLQHAGMYFWRPPGSTVWQNMHYYKGLHRGLPAANVARTVPAVTGAAMMVSAELYRRMGGLQGMYVQGDYEDSDLCLRLMEAGYQNWYLPHVELYHLEGQSYPAALRKLAGRYNRWLHSRLWAARIEDVMAGFGNATQDPSQLLRSSNHGATRAEAAASWL